MIRIRIPSRVARLTAVAAILLTMGAAVDPGKTPAVGDTARDFELTDLGGDKVKLSTFTADGPVVLVILRGWPGYQCPICTKQFSGFMAKADDFKKAGAQLIFVYPGPADALKDHAAEFVRGKDIPADFHFTLDPDYSVIKDYGLRWDKPKETAYPSTFVIAKGGVVKFAKVSKTHADRASADDVLKVLNAKD
jgi:peroxiredoxin Q/BCP